MGFVSIRFSKTVVGDPAIMRRLAQPLAVAVATAAHIKRRVQERGQTATRPDPYDPTSRKARRFVIGDNYAALVPTPNLANSFGSSADFHRAIGVPIGKFSVTGGMWRGMVARNYGADAAIISFDGSSLGRKSDRLAIRERKRRGKKRGKLVKDAADKTQFRQVSRRIRNALKASAVFTATRIGLLQPTYQEGRAQFAAVQTVAGRLLAATFGMRHTASPEGDSALYSAILRAYRGLGGT